MRSRRKGRLGPRTAWDSFLGLLEFRGKVDLSRFSREKFKRLWSCNNAIFEERNDSFLFIARG